LPSIDPFRSPINCPLQDRQLTRARNGFFNGRVAGLINGIPAIESLRAPARWEHGHAPKTQFQAFMP
jgi:hypothetical protein